MRAWIYLSLCVLLGACATTDEQRFPLTQLAGREASYHLETAREALPVYQRMAAELERRGQYGDAAVAYLNARQTALTLGRLQEELDAAQGALRTAERSGNAELLVDALNRLGFMLTEVNAPLKAKSLLDRALALTSKINDHRVREAESHLGLSRVYHMLGNQQQALVHSMTGATIMEEYISQVISWRWDTTAAGRTAIRSFENLYRPLLYEVCIDHRALGALEPARQACERGLAVARRNGSPYQIARAETSLAYVAISQQDWPAAVSHLEEALRLHPTRDKVAWAGGLLGQVYYRQGQLPAAEHALRQAIADLEDLRGDFRSIDLRESFFEDKGATYEFLVLTLLAQGKVADAFDMSERARARAFLDLLGNRPPLGRHLSPALLAEEHDLRERISALKAQPEEKPALQRELDLAREAYQAFLQRVRQVDQEQASLLTVAPLTLPEVQALLPEGTTLLEYFVTGQGKTILWSVTRDRVAVHLLPIGRADLAGRVQAFRAAIASRAQPDETAALAQALYAALVRPGLEGATPRELVVVPHDALHYLPFQALMPEPGHYLLQDAPLHYYSSASLMQFTRAKTSEALPTLFALGNPDLGDPTLTLRYAEREVREIARLFSDTVLVTGPAATKTAVRQESGHKRILHFAAHAELDEADPLGSALRLTPAAGDDGRLEVQEVFGLELHASLVVLSACNTALGHLSRGDEITGLTRAFIYAGTPTVITTLWQVSDRASYELMQEFYRQLQTGATKAAALRAAQLATLQQYDHPYYWAAYELTGEGG